MPPRQAIDRNAILQMTALCAIWGLQQVSIKAAAPDMSPIFQVAIRSGIAAPLIFLLILFRREWTAMTRRTAVPGLLVGLFFALEFLFVGEGLRFTSASHMAIFLYTAPIFTVLGLHLKLHEERLTATQWCGILLAFGGVALSFAGQAAAAAGGGLVWLGDLLGILAAMSWAATTLSIRFTTLSSAPASVTLFYQLAGAFLLLMTAAMLTGGTGITLTPTLFASMGFQIVMVSLVSFLAWFALLRRYLASRLGALSFMTPVFGVLFGATLLNEALDPGFIAGAALVLAGIMLVNARDLIHAHPWRRALPPPSGLS